MRPSEYIRKYGYEAFTQLMATKPLITEKRPRGRPKKTEEVKQPQRKFKKVYKQRGRKRKIKTEYIEGQLDLFGPENTMFCMQQRGELDLELPF